VYASVIVAGTHLAPSIKVAEAAKAIENAQRDINIALVNELAVICERLAIDTHDVLEAAGTKWNFLAFRPGLVGGHCIGVDPYYLAQCAQKHGYNPGVILAGRQLNDSMGEFVANQVVKLMLKKGIRVIGSSILILGFTFKENCPDIRNTKVLDIVDALEAYEPAITVYDRRANASDAMRMYGVTIVGQLPGKKYDAAILAVAHDEFKMLSFTDFMKAESVIYDVKGILKRDLVDGRL
jgi:UDP-N-acetyl-D-galactosamine dehydrogenase